MNPFVASNAMVGSWGEKERLIARRKASTAKAL